MHCSQYLVTMSTNNKCELLCCCERNDALPLGLPSLLNIIVLMLSRGRVLIVLHQHQPWLRVAAAAGGCRSYDHDPLLYHVEGGIVRQCWMGNREACRTWQIFGVRSVVSSAEVEHVQIISDAVQREAPQHEGMSLAQGSTVLEYLHELGIGKQAIKRACKMDSSWVSRISLQNFRNVVKFLLRYGLSKKELETLLHKAPLIFTCSSEQKLERRVRDLKELYIDEKTIKKIIRRCPSILSLNYENNLLPKVLFLESIGIDRKNIGKMICSFPHTLNYSLENSLKAKVQYFERLGLDRKSIAKMFLRYPPIVGCSIELNIKLTIKFLESAGMEKKGIVQILTRCPIVIGCSIEKKLKPTIRFLEDAGLTRENIGKQLTRWPHILGRSIKGCLSDRLRFLAQLGFGVDSKQYAKAIGETSSLSLKTLEGKIEHLLQCGLSKDDVSKIVRAQPTILKKSTLDISTKMELFFSILTQPVPDLVKNPIFLLYSYDKRIKPRLRLMAWLHERGLIKKKYNFSTIVRMSQQEFLNRFISLHPQGIVIFNPKEEI